MFAAWAEPEAKARWFGGGPTETPSSSSTSGSAGGSSAAAPRQTATAYTFEARYQDIVPDERIVYTYDMLPRRTADLRLAGDGGVHARRRRHPADLTEQGAFLDGLDTPAPARAGLAGLLESLAVELRWDPTST